jgi:hypothetical protein
MYFATPGKSTLRPRGSVLWLVCLVFCFHPPAAAQETASVTFTFDFPGSEPSHYSILISSDGRATYQSDGKLSAQSEGDPSRLDFVISQPTRAHIFDLAKRAHYFAGDIDSRKKGLASTGAKVLAYQDARRNTQATYNYSPLPAVQELTSLFQNISTTLEFGRRLEYFYRYQKLALDEELKRMEEMRKQNSLEEVSAVAPILQKIAADPAVINVVRARAQRLLEGAGAGKR